MQRMLDAVADPSHMYFLLTIVFVNIGAQIADVVADVEINYRFLSYAFTIAFVSSFTISLIRGPSQHD